MRKKFKYWNKKTCAEEALKYNTRGEFRLKSMTAYNLSLKMKWADEICAHMQSFRNPKNFWTKEECTKEALKYNSKVDFIKYCVSAYNSAIKNGWLEEITKHMIRPTPYNKKWDKNACKNEALKYSSRVDFQKKSGSAYVSAYMNGWLDDICSHMQRPANSRIIWNKETCRIEALKYKTRSEFSKKAKRAHIVAIKLDILDEICSHMKTCGSLIYRGIYAYEFPDNHAYVGLTYNFDIRHKQHMNHKKSAIYKYIHKTNLSPTHKILSNYVDVYLAQKLEKEFYLQYKNNGWIMLNNNRTGGVGWNKLPKNRIMTIS
jgi:predicted GIY-YIG superfamily endonuclease